MVGPEMKKQMENALLCLIAALACFAVGLLLANAY